MFLVVFVVAACSSEPGSGEIVTDGTYPDPSAAKLILPELVRSATSGESIRVVATTGIIGDVVSAVAGDSAEVSVLMAANQDPHSYQSTAGDMQLVADADVVFVNGWRLEEGLIDDLESAAGDTIIVPVSAGIEPRLFDEDQPGNHANRVDPHVWLAPANVAQWVVNINTVLSNLDPSNAELYSKRADAYLEQLDALDTYYREQLSQVEEGQHLLVTNHDAFGYVADAFGLEVIGTIVHGDSTLAEPASRDLADLVERMSEVSLCAIFVEHSASQELAQQLAAELDHCEQVQIVALYSGSLGEVGSGAETYLQMMTTNIDTIVGALSGRGTVPLTD